jgi:chromosome segregation protein
MSNLLISLELQGYKTFASKTDFRFPAPLTAIVGPNGSGKSNIADAIRWVLGEQAYSLLRGKKTIDMIFSGSEQRSRASMASVSITFDNTSGWLPIDFNEVNLTRRAYRNGENEYLINNQKVRLKEINELLANSGLSERNYTIIGQGLVDSALSLKPEDRRSFFEEAAGIGLYRSRRSESNRRLEKTLRNVERVNDIVAELKPRLRSLEKQQEKSASYLQIDADLKLLLKDWYGYHWHRTQGDLREAIKVNATLQEKVNQTRDESKALESQLERSQRLLGDKRAKLSELHRSLSALHVEKEENARNIAVLEEREQAQKNRVAELQRAYDMDQVQLNALSSEIDDLVKMGERTQDEFAQMEKDLQDAQANLDGRLSRRNQIESEIYERENKVNQVTQEVLRLQTLTEGLKNQINLRESDMAELKIRKQRDEKLFLEQQELLRTKQEQTALLSSDLESITKSKNGVTSEISELKLKIEEQKANRTKCADMLRELKGQYKLLEEAENSLLGFTSGAKSLVEALKTGKLNGNYRLLMDLLEVPQKYEEAIASVLGVIIEGIIVETPQESESMIDFIKRSNSARTILIENRDLKLPKRSQPNSLGLTNAADVVKKDINTPDQVIISNLLSNVYIAEDLSSARRALENLVPGSRIVTLSGEVFAADGTIMVGKEARTKNFERKREKTETANEIVSTQATLKDIEEKLDSLQVAFIEKNALLESIAADLKQKELSRNQLDLDIHKLQIEQTQRQEQIENEKNRLDQFSADMAKENADVQQLVQKVSELQKEVIAQKELNESSYLQLQDLPVEDLRGTVMDMHSKLAVARKMVETNQTRLSEKKTLLDQYKKECANIEERISGLKTSLADIGKQMQEVISRDQTVNQQIELLTQETHPLENQVDQEITDQGSFLEEVDAARQKYAIAERHKMQAQIKVEKLRERLEQYQQKIGEDFGIFTSEEGTAFGPKPLPIAGIVSQLPVLEQLPEGISDHINQKKSLIRRIGPVNPNAQQEYQEVAERYQFLTDQLLDLQKAQSDLRKIVDELDELMKREFLKTFIKVAVEFENIFAQLFNGGSAKLLIEDEENVMDSGIDIEATLPGRRKQELALLSGGERSLTAVALIFALLKISPTPFCILDEIDAMLDESNVMRVGEMLKELCDTTQFIIITHNRNTVQLADIIYGVTMGKDSVSQVISLKLDELTDEMVH